MSLTNITFENIYGGSDSTGTLNFRGAANSDFHIKDITFINAYATLPLIHINSGDVYSLENIYFVNCTIDNSAYIQIDDGDQITINNMEFEDSVVTGTFPVDIIKIVSLLNLYFRLATPIQLQP
jgi:hypothetical protein